ncbi:MAG TPA: GAF domain-containing protein [Candidatus Sulfomarinibacteraceae bacterium]|nr:GAF domain-containing protein [Candidatus Sulfomarinibacteraceae bacterium]
MRSEQKLYLAWREHRLINLIDPIIFEMDREGHWIFLSPAWEAVTGYPVQATLGDNFLDYLHPDERKKGLLLFQVLLERGQEVVQDELRFCGANGEVYWLELSARLSHSQNGHASSIAGSLLDISGRKEGEEQRALQASRDLSPGGVNYNVLATDLAQRIAAGTPLHELYEWLVQAMAASCDYYQSYLMRYEPHEEALVTLAAAAADGAGPLLERYRTPIGAGLAGRVAASGRPLLQTDLAPNTEGPSETEPDGDAPVEAGSLASVRAPEGAVEALAAPVARGDTLLGALVVFSDEPGRLGDGDVTVVEGIASQLATAMDNAYLREQLEERAAELNNLRRLVSREGWLQARPGREEGVLGYRFDPRTMQLVEAQDGLTADGKVNGDGNGSSQPPRALTAPLQVRGETFGVLGVEAGEEESLTDSERDLLRAVSEQVAEALEYARLLEQTQKRAVELETVSRVSAATATILEREKLLGAVVELTKRSFDLYHAHIYLLDEEQKNLVLAAGSGDAGEQMVQRGWQIALDHPRSVVARAAREKEGIIVNDVRSEQGFLSNPLLPDTRSELAVPMISGNRLLGVLDVQSSTPNSFTQDDVRIQSALANQVATALQNATLYQEQLETAEKLREFDRLKSEFLASMSHELRTPLNSIIGFADVLLEGIDGDLNPRMEEDVVLIRNSGQHLRELIGDILDMSKIEAGMMDLRYEEIDVPELVHEIEAFARTQLMTYEKELDFRVDIGPHVGTLRVDRTRFKQVLYNLISNAIKFTAEGSVTLSLRMEGDDLLVEVSDTGIGIKEENIPIVFEQFRQVDGSLTRKAGGTGLGLSISKSLVELHGGEIWVESEEDQGTTFGFTIPADSAPGGDGDQAAVEDGNGEGDGP